MKIDWNEIAVLCLGIAVGFICQRMSDDHQAAMAAVRSYQAKEYYYTRQADAVIRQQPAKEKTRNVRAHRSNP